MLKLFFVVLMSVAFSLAGSRPSVAGSKSFLGGAIAGGVGVMLLHSMNRNNNNKRARPARRERVSRPAPRRRIVRRRHPSAALEPRMSRETKRDIQQALNAREFNVGFADGSFGGNTRRGIKRFQSSISAPVTGYLTQRQVSLLLDPPVAPRNPVVGGEPQNPLAGRLPVAPAQGYNTAPAYKNANAAPTYSNAQTFQSLESTPKPTLTVASRGYSNSGKKGYLEDAPQ